ncbi:MAG: T9SS type A sorting domain-containing protein [Dysgonamonadaceae bacterium]|nr:T9SS type A sorting domain-containing protein [Dysgonamonadaceae bacterium]
MKTKSIFLVFLLAIFAGTNVFAVTHGSIIKKNAPIVDEAAGTFWAGINATVDFKAVTVNNTLWATFTGKGNYNLAGNGWSSQVQLYTGAAKTNEISIASGETNYITVNQATKTMIVTAYPLAANEANFNGFRALQEDNNNFGWTNIMTYNQAAPSSGLDDDTEAPVLTAAVEGEQVGASLPITCTASDDSGDYFYLVTDEANNYAYASFTDAFTIGGLKPATAYTLRVVAVDFSGNESEPKTIQIGEKPFESVLSGVAGAIEFELGSTATELQIRAKPVAAGATFSNLNIQVGDENTVFSGTDPLPYDVVYLDFAGLPSITYSIKNATIFTTAPDGIVYLNFTYILGPNNDPGGEQADWDAFYAKTAIYSVLTEGTRAGEKIAIKLGDGEIVPTALSSINSEKMKLVQEGQSWNIRSQEAIQSVEIYSVSGQRVYAGQSASVSVSNLPQGVYVLKATDVKGHREVIKTLVK